MAVAATSCAAFDQAIALTRRLKLPNIRRAMAEIIPTAKAQHWHHVEVVRALLAEEAASCDAAKVNGVRSTTVLTEVGPVQMAVHTHSPRARGWFALPAARTGRPTGPSRPDCRAAESRR